MNRRRARDRAFEVLAGGAALLVLAAAVALFVFLMFEVQPLVALLSLMPSEPVRPRAAHATEPVARWRLAAGASDDVVRVEARGREVTWERSGADSRRDAGRLELPAPVTAAAATSSGLALLSGAAVYWLPRGAAEPRPLSPEWDGRPLALAAGGQPERLFVGTEGGQIAILRPRPEGPVILSHVLTAPGPVTALALLPEGRALAVGTATGTLHVFSEVRAPDGAWQWSLLHTLEGHPSRIVALAAAPRRRLLASADRAGGLRLHHTTSEQSTGRIDAGLATERLRFNSDGRSLVAEGPEGRRTFRIDAPHPEATFETLFLPVRYEQHRRPALLWQSTGATDRYEPKLSLVPLVAGTLKGALVALFFAFPVGLLSALYSACFLPQRLRQALRIPMELLASVPSVILGLVAATYLGPWLSHHLSTLLAALISLPALTLLGALSWHAIPRHIRSRVGDLGRLTLITATTLAGFAAAGPLGRAAEVLFFDGSFLVWFQSDLGIPWTQRNALLVGLALGVAVVPLVFSLVEDGLSAVPAHLMESALACGASRWQAAARVVLPAAFPTVAAACLLAFGRACGETLVALMASGNTPLTALTPTVGLRTLAANLAIELPEAPGGGTLYRVLVLSALLLFALTFALNSAALWLGRRLQRRLEGGGRA